MRSRPAAYHTCEWRFCACPRSHEHDRLVCFNSCWQSTEAYFHEEGNAQGVPCCRYAWFAPDVSAPIFNWVGAAASLLSRNGPTDVGQVRWLMLLVCVCPTWFALEFGSLWRKPPMCKSKAGVAKQDLRYLALSDFMPWQAVYA